MSAAVATVSTTKEGQLLEVAQAAQARELQEPDATRPDNITIAPDFEANQVTITATLPIAVTTNATGKLEIEAQEYLT